MPGMIMASCTSAFQRRRRKQKPLRKYKSISKLNPTGNLGGVIAAPLLHFHHPQTVVVPDLMLLFAYMLLGLYILTTCWLLLNAAVQLQLLWHARKQKARMRKVSPSRWPSVTVQLPIYNEQHVVERLIQSVAALDYPKHLLHIQVLDDSTDETRFLVDKIAAAVQVQGINIQVVRRPDRKHYKAGALQYGLQFCSSELIAIFDADFVPQPSFLKKLVPYFSHARTGLVQARWAHLNKHENFLTYIQTFLLDMHFKVEQAGRYNAGFLINFCGTAGIWRLACIEDAGGWDGRVLSEDLDLSYRAQLRGWRMVYDPSVEVPAELPSVMEAFKTQQFRWTKGIAQSFKKHLAAVIRSSLPLTTKLNAFFHLSSSLVFLCLFVNALLTVPLLVFRNIYPQIRDITGYTVIGALNVVSATLIYYYATHNPRRRGSVRFFMYYPLFVVVYMALSVQNAWAVLQGFFARKTAAFIRTPKGRDQFAVTKSANRVWVTCMEVLTLVYFLTGISFSFYFHDFFMLLFFCLFGSGLMLLLWEPLVHWWTQRKLHYNTWLGGFAPHNS